MNWTIYTIITIYSILLLFNSLFAVYKLHMTQRYVVGLLFPVMLLVAFNYVLIPYPHLSLLVLLCSMYSFLLSFIMIYSWTTCVWYRKILIDIIPACMCLLAWLISIDESKYIVLVVYFTIYIRFLILKVLSESHGRSKPLFISMVTVPIFTWDIPVLLILYNIISISFIYIICIYDFLFIPVLLYMAYRYSKVNLKKWFTFDTKKES